MITFVQCRTAAQLEYTLAPMNKSKFIFSDVCVQIIYITNSDFFTLFLNILQPTAAQKGSSAAWEIIATRFVTEGAERGVCDAHGR